MQPVCSVSTTYMLYVYLITELIIFYTGKWLGCMFPSLAQALAGIALSLCSQAELLGKDCPHQCPTYSISKLPVCATRSSVSCSALDYLLLVFKDFLLFCFAILFSYI